MVLADFIVLDNYALAAPRWFYDGRDEQPDRRETRSGLARIGFDPVPFPKPIHTK